MNKNIMKSKRLKGLVAHTVAFVKNPANKRPFALLKGEKMQLNLNGQNSNSNSKGTNVMRNSVLSQFTALLAKGQSFSEIKKSLQESEDLEVSSEEFETLEKLYEIKVAAESQNLEKAENKNENTDTNQDAQAAENAALRERLAKMERLEAQRVQKDWLEHNAPFADVNVDETARILCEMEESNSPGIDAFRASLIKSSAANERSDTFSTIGHVRDGRVSTNNRSNIIKQVEENLNVVEKSANAPKNEVDRISVALASLDQQSYRNYVNSFLSKNRI